MNIQKLDIVLPCYNPHEGWGNKIVETMKLLQARFPDELSGLIVVNDGSRNGVYEAEASSLKQHLPEVRLISYELNQGKGAALRKGVGESSSEFVLYTDIDFPYDLESMIRAIQYLLDGEADVVAGSRTQAYYDQYPSDRKFISKILQWFIRNVLRLRISDTQCGLKGFNQKGKEIFLATGIKRFLFDLEFIYLASRKKELRIIPVQAVLRPDVKFSKVNLRVLITESFNFLSIFLRTLFKRRDK